MIPIPVVTPKEMEHIDGRAIGQLGIPGMVLMENAACAVLRVLQEVYRPCPQDKIVILAGVGNNGGDGFALARHVTAGGGRAAVLIINPQKREIQGDARTNLDILLRLGTPVTQIVTEGDLAHALHGAADAAVFVDALFGIGLTRPLEGLYAQAAKWLNGQDKPILAVDIPSGVDGETGAVRGIAVSADHTVTFGYLKRGHLLYPGRSHAGVIHTAAIGFPQDSPRAARTAAFTLDASDAAKLLPPRPAEGHKGAFGRLAVLAGSPGLTGAAYLTAQSASKSGAGLVTLGLPAALQPILAVKLSEVMTQALPDGGTGHLTRDSLPEIDALLSGKDVLALGPGLGKSLEVFHSIRHILRTQELSIVLDADGLNHISQDMTLLKEYRGEAVLTPHPGEMARITGGSIPEILSDPAFAARAFAMDHRCVLLLKGSATLVADPRGRLYINRTGNAGMAAGGSGDCLTGVIGALLAQGLPAFEGAVLGCFLHGLAGDLAAAEKGEAGMTAVDLMEAVPQAFKALSILRGGTNDKNCIEDF